MLTPEEYDSAKRTTFDAFSPWPVVVSAIYEGLARLGVPSDATLLEPGSRLTIAVAISRHTLLTSQSRRLTCQAGPRLGMIPKLRHPEAGGSEYGGLEIASKVSSSLIRPIRVRLSRVGIDPTINGTWVYIRCRS